MNFRLQAGAAESSFCNILVIRDESDINHPLLEGMSATLERKIRDKDNGWITWYGKDEVRIIAILKDSNGKRDHELTEEARVKGAQALKKANYEKAATATVVRVSDSVSTEEMEAFIEGMCLAGYQFLRYRTEKKENTVKTVGVENSGLDQGALDMIAAVTDANFAARDLINEPVLQMDSVQLAAFAAESGKKHGFQVTVLNKQEIEKLGMGGLLGVNKGSSVPPTFSVLEYKPEKAVHDKPFILVGKGVTYDTGGYSLKPGNFMATMKCDMSGAAAVIGTMIAVASNELPIHLIGLVPSTDNRVNSDALVPDDIITMSDGTTVEVLNTDAEGRLILADALHYAKQYDPELVIDLATLTGAAAAITGNLGAALMGTDTKYREILINSGNATYERLWEIPYWKEFADMLKGDIADLKNIGGPVGGSATAGKFLEHFTDYPWLHLDIAGPAFLKEDQDYKQKGAVGFGVRLLFHFFRSISLR